MDPDPDPDVFVIADKNYIFKSLFAYGVLLSEGKVHLHHFSKIKSHNKSHKTVGIKVFLTVLLDGRRIRIRTSDYWIQIRIQEA
jgi:hypothetical protein